MQPTMAMKVHTPSSYLARSSSRDSSFGVFGSIARVNMYARNQSKVAYTKMSAEVSAQRGLDRVFLTSASVGELYTIHPSSRALSLAARQAWASSVWSSVSERRRRMSCG